MRRRTVAGAIVLLSAAAAACGIPRDPEGTLQRIRETGVLRAGITARPPWTTETGGPEAEAVQAFAQTLGARVEWHRGSESELFEALEKFELDVAVGGFTEDNPWAPKLGATRPYIEAGGRKHIAFTAPGENRLLLEFDRLMRSQAPAIAARTGGRPQS